MSKASIAAKQAQVVELAEKIKNASAAVLVSFSGVTVAQDTKLRNDFRAAGVTYKVYKNSILIRAFESLGIKGFENLAGDNALALASEDSTAAARIAVEHSEKTALTVKCGLMDGAFIDEAQVKQIAKIPAKPQLVAQLLCVLQSPMRSLAIALSEIAKKNAA